MVEQVRNESLRQPVTLTRLTPEQIVDMAVNSGYGPTTVRCHGYNLRDGNVLTAANFVNGDPLVSPIGSYTGIGDMVTADGDAYLATLPVAAAGRHGHILTLPLMPGLLNLYEQQGITDSAANLASRLHIVNPQVTAGQVLGHPYTNPIHLLEKTGKRFDSDMLFAATFPTEETKKAAIRLGLRPVQESHQRLATKSLLHQKAVEYGIKMLEGHVINTPEQVVQAAEFFASHHTGKIWFKIPFASGGDGVFAYDGEMTPEAFRQQINRLRHIFSAAFKTGDFDGMTVNDAWPPGNIAPSSGVLVEWDAQDQYEKLTGRPCKIQNCSNVLITDKSHHSVIAGEFEQITTNGAFVGSRSIRHRDDEIDQIDQNNRGIVGFATTELNHYGILGTDYIIVRNAETDEVLGVNVLEINLRDSISYNAQAAAANVYHRHNSFGSFINTNLRFSEPITSLNQLRHLTTLNSHSLLDGDMEKGMLVPIAVRTLFQEKPDGNTIPVAPSPVVKCVIVGQNSQQCAQIREQLRQK